ncbi:hypothetical protein BH09GEM1_BH09GEM1_19900 [soil metagenome]
MENQPVLDTIDPELVERLAVRRAEIERGSLPSKGVIAALALGSVPIALAALSKDLYAQGIPTAIKNVLDFALALEIFENEFYKAVLGMSSSTAQNSAFASVRASAALVPGAATTLGQIQKHEVAHVATLTALGATNVFSLDANSFDFTGNRSATGGGPFAKATTDLAFLLQVAQAAEDTGVRAYKGQAANLMSSPAILEGALRIHSVEARHASRIRRIRRIAAGAPATVRYSGTVRGGELAAAGGTDLGTNPTAVTNAFNKIYGAGATASSAPSESNTTHAGIDVNALGLSFGIEAAQEAFDEPLDRGDVIAIVQPFFIPNIA